nr:glycosyltransferase family 2 protein [Ligilactobacillus ruminis]
MSRIFLIIEEISYVGQSIGIDNLELIFVNDASKDDGQTWNMLNEIEEAYPESLIIIDLTCNRRQGGARNEGLKYASGEYIAFVDADDWVEEPLFVYSLLFYANKLVKMADKLYVDRTITGLCVMICRRWTSL